VQLGAKHLSSGINRPQIIIAHKPDSIDQQSELYILPDHGSWFVTIANQYSLFQRRKVIIQCIAVTVQIAPKIR